MWERYWDFVLWPNGGDTPISLCGWSTLVWRTLLLPLFIMVRVMYLVLTWFMFGTDEAIEMHHKMKLTPYWVVVELDADDINAAATVTKENHSDD